MRRGDGRSLFDNGLLSVCVIDDAEYTLVSNMRRQQRRAANEIMSREHLGCNLTKRILISIGPRHGMILRVAEGILVVVVAFDLSRVIES